MFSQHTYLVDDIALQNITFFYWFNLKYKNWGFLANPLRKCPLYAPETKILCSCLQVRYQVSTTMNEPIQSYQEYISNLPTTAFVLFEQQVLCSNMSVATFFIFYLLFNLEKKAIHLHLSLHITLGMNKKKFCIRSDSNTKVINLACSLDGVRKMDFSIQVYIFFIHISFYFTYKSNSL